MTHFDTTSEPVLALGPTGESERVAIIDVLRGFALLGILLVNMEFFVSPSYRFLDAYAGYSLVNRAAIWAVRFFAEGKFYVLFSFLFGYGFAIQMRRAAERGGRFGSVCARRLVALLFIAMFHAVVLWFGDILFLYALMGFVLLLFRHRATKTLVIWGCCVVVLPVLMLAFVVGMMHLAAAVPGEGEKFAKGMAEYSAVYHEAVAIGIAAYSSGSIVDVFGQRLLDWAHIFGLLLFMCPSVLAMFLFGAASGRVRLLERAGERPELVWRVLIGASVLGLAGNVVHVVLAEGIDFVIPTWDMVMDVAVTTWSGPALSVAYVSGVVLLMRRRSGGGLVSRMGAMGRTALSCYLGQSVICTTLAFSYGFGLYGRVEPAVGVATVFLIYGFQLLAARWWLGRYRFGPMEWVWRSVTYRRFQPMRGVG